MIKAKGSKTYTVSVLKAGWMDYPFEGYKQYLTEKTANQLTQGLRGLKPLLEHIETSGEIYTKRGQNQIVGICVKSYNINEPFIIEDKKYRFEDYSACEIIIDDIETINKIDKFNYRPSIHFTRKEVLIDKASDDIDYIVRNDGKVYKLVDFKVQNIAFVSDPRYETQVRLSKDNLTDEDRGIINPVFRSQVVNNYQFNCINSKCMFKKNVKNSDGVAEKMAILEMKLDKILAYIDAEQGEGISEEVANQDATLQEMPVEDVKPEVINAIATDESINEEKSMEEEKPVEEKKDEVKNQETISKEEIAKMIEDGIKKYMEVKNSCESKNEESDKKEKDEEVLNSKSPVVAKKVSLFTAYNNPIKEAVMQTPNHQKDNKPKTLGGAIFC